MSRMAAEREKEIRARVSALPGEDTFDPAYLYKNPHADVSELLAEIDALRGQLDEQCRLNGKGQERELKLITERDALQCRVRGLEYQYREENLRLMKLMEAVRNHADLQPTDALYAVLTQLTELDRAERGGG